MKEEPPSEEDRLGKRENVPSNHSVKEESRESISRVPRSRWEFDETTEDRDARLGRTRQNRENTKEEDFKWGKEGDEGGKKKPIENKAKPDFGLSGKLAEEVNTYKGVVIKYSEPPEARIPKTRWRLYPFKGDENLPTMYIHRQSGYLIGRERKIADIPVDHPSCSKQHAVLQYRLVPYTRADGTKGQRIRPYIIDLESANGTYVNNKQIEPKKYVELLEKDVLKFAYSSREYVLLHEHSKDDILDDDPVE